MLLSDSLKELNTIYQRASNEARESLQLVECNRIEQFEKENKDAKLRNKGLQQRLIDVSPAVKNFYTIIRLAKPKTKGEYELCNDFQEAITKPISGIFDEVKIASTILHEALTNLDSEDLQSTPCAILKDNKKNTELLRLMLSVITNIDQKLKKVYDESKQDLKDSKEVNSGLIKNSIQIIAIIKGKTADRVNAPTATNAPVATAAPITVLPKQTGGGKKTKRGVNNKKNMEKFRKGGITLTEQKTPLESKRNIEIYTAAKNLLAGKKVTSESVDALTELENKIRREKAWLILNDGPPIPALSPDQCWLKSKWEEPLPSK